MIYSILDWACDQIKSYEAHHGFKPDHLFVTPEQAIRLRHASEPLLTYPVGPVSIDTVEAVRRGEFFLLGVPLKLFEVGHGR